MAFGFVLQPLGAVAGEPLRQGVIKAQAIQPLPPGFPMSVSIYDDNDLSLEIKAKMEDALKSNGHLVVEKDGALDFQIDNRMAYVEVLERRPYLGEAKTTPLLGASVSVNVWSAQQDSLIGGEGVFVAGNRDTSFHIDVSLRDAETGRVLWQADAYGGNLVNGDPRSVMDSMIEVIAQSVGERLEPRAFATY